jgi:hypothetical protein
VIEVLVTSRTIASAISSADDTWRTGRPFRGGEIVSTGLLEHPGPPGCVDQAGGDRVDAPRREFDGQRSHDRLADERNRGLLGQVRQGRLQHGQHRYDLLVEPVAQLGQVEVGERAQAGRAGDGEHQCVDGREAGGELGDGRPVVEFLEQRRAALATLVERARRRGDLPATLTAGFAADVVFGVLWYRLLAIPQPFDHHLTDHLVALLTTGA